MEIEKIYIDHRVITIDSKDTPAAVTVKFSNGEHCHIMVSKHKSGLNAYVSQLKRERSINKRIIKAYKESNKLTFIIELYDTKTAACQRFDSMVDKNNIKCLTTGHKTHYTDNLRGPAKPGAYTIYIGDYYYHGYSSRLNRRVKSHMSELLNGRHHNLKLQELYDDGHLPMFKFYITDSTQTAKELEYKLVNDNLGDQSMLNIVNDTFGSMNHPRKSCIVDGVEYSSVHEAAKLTGLSRPTIRKRREG